jgi:hypothetical protein
MLLETLLSIALLAPPDESVQIARMRAVDDSLDPAARIGALTALYKADSQAGQDVAGGLLGSPDPGLRLTAATIRLRSGLADGEQTLVRMLQDHKLEPGYRGLAARRLGAARAKGANAPVRSEAIREADLVLLGGGAPDRDGYRWGLLKALGGYASPADTDVALRLYQATGLRGPARPIGLFGSASALPLLREALSRSSDAGTHIDIQLAIARSGGHDGVDFIRALLRSAAAVGLAEREIDLRTEDPTSGRLADRVLDDLGSHRSDKQFIDDLFPILRASACSFCSSTWAAIARLGPVGREPQIIAIVRQMGTGRSDEALRVLAYAGSENSVRALAKDAHLERRGEDYISAHKEGLDRSWFRTAASNWD